MSKLISGKEAFDKAYDGFLVEYLSIGCTNWCDFNGEDWGVSDLKSGKYKFRLKPKTITINGIEVPAPFDPKVGEYVYFISSDEIKGYAETTLEDTPMNWGVYSVWRMAYRRRNQASSLGITFNF